MDTLRHWTRLPYQQRPTIEDHIGAAGVESLDPLSSNSLEAAATLVTTPCGSPIRTIVTGRKVMTTGVYVSRKAGRALPFESMNERAFFMHCEVDTDVEDYRAQPFRFEFVIDGRKRTYIADCARLMADGALEVVEVKSDHRALKDPDYAAKIQRVRTLCEHVGWRFRVVTKSNLFEPVYFFRNVDDIQSWRMTTYSDADVFRSAARLQNGSATVGELAGELGQTTDGAAKLKAMMVKRVIRIDLTQPLSTSSSVSLVMPKRESVK